MMMLMMPMFMNMMTVTMLMLMLTTFARQILFILFHSPFQVLVVSACCAGLSSP